MKKTFGGHRLGAGKKMEVELKHYERSTHNLGYIYRTSQAPGTLVPFLVQVALPGDTFDIKLNSDVKTHPTLGPLFGSFKHQLDLFVAPIRLYHSALLQNMVTLGNNMATVLLPQLSNTAIAPNTTAQGFNPDNVQVNPSALLSYLGIRGWGWNVNAGTATRNLNAIPTLIYWETYKLFYANKQELNGYYIQQPTAMSTVSAVSVSSTTIPQAPATVSPVWMVTGSTITCVGSLQDINQIYFGTPLIGQIPATQIGSWSSSGLVWTLNTMIMPPFQINNWGYIPVTSLTAPTSFPLSNIDAVKSAIFAQNPLNQYTITSGTLAPFGPMMTPANMLGSQNSLALKTYQSDLFNNWLNISWYNTITTNTSISTGGGSFTIDTLILAKKLYEFLNDVAVSGGTYIDWIHAAYAHNPYSQCYTPMYYGGLSKEVVFQEVISLAAQGTQPLGTLAGRGMMHSKHKGGTIHIKIDEPSFILGIQSLTPRIDYSQGNFWYTYALNNMDNLHKPPLDQIGFQNGPVTDQMAWWDTHSTSPTTWSLRSAGYQPAWLNYMTEINRTFGNFAVNNNEMFMTLNRRYTMDTSTNFIKDLTTYIDPTHYNFIFAQTSIDAQNFWVQISVDMVVRRKMSAKIMPHL